MISPPDCAFPQRDMGTAGAYARPRRGYVSAIMRAIVDGVTGPGPPSKQAALATALLMARCARLAWRAAVVPHIDGVTESRGYPRSKHRGETTMNHYAGIDVSLECSSVCVVDANGKILREA